MHTFHVQHPIPLPTESIVHMKLVVPGGNGFIGTEICRIAVQHGHDVAAFGRSGRPALTPARHPWTQEVEWRAASVFEPDTWRDLLDGVDAVIHCIGTIREAPERDITFPRVNANAALLAADEATEAGAETFVFLSGRDTPPFIDDTFLAAKRRVERELPTKHPALRVVSLRPNLVYGSRQPGTATLAAVLNQCPSLVSHPYASRSGRPLPVERVAAAAVQAAVAPSLEGTLTIDQIDDIGRTSGLVTPEAISAPSLAPLVYGLGGAALAAWLLSRWLRR